MNPNTFFFHPTATTRHVWVERWTFWTFVGLGLFQDWYFVGAKRSREEALQLHTVQKTMGAFRGGQRAKKGSSSNIPISWT